MMTRVANILAMGVALMPAMAHAQIRPIQTLAVPPAAPQVDQIQLQLNQLREENQRLRADLDKLKTCFDAHKHWLVGIAPNVEITKPTATGQAPGFVPMPPYCQ